MGGCKDRVGTGGAHIKGASAVAEHLAGIKEQKNVEKKASQNETIMTKKVCNTVKATQTLSKTSAEEKKVAAARKIKTSEVKLHVVQHGKAAPRKKKRPRQ